MVLSCPCYFPNGPKIISWKVISQKVMGPKFFLNSKPLYIDLLFCRFG